jgi:N-acetyl-gamma-glutamyl-phosphate reductase
VVDCGADHRLTDPVDWADFYGGEFYGAWTYGLPELVHADGSKQRALLPGASRIAVPGCNVTAITLGIAPAVQAGAVLADDLVAVLAVGPSGAGKALAPHLLASEMLGSASAYGVGGVHRHTPEIRQNIRQAGGTNVSISFTPMLVPMSRGILATTTAKLAPGATAAHVHDAFEAAYADEPFVHLLPAGEYPRTADALGANVALIGVAIDEAAGRVVTVTAIDNLVKGTAGAAIQSANLALGLSETSGLTTNGVAP